MLFTTIIVHHGSEMFPSNHNPSEAIAAANALTGRGEVGNTDDFTGSPMPGEVSLGLAVMSCVAKVRQVDG
jgi:hypothetical protein